MTRGLRHHAVEHADRTAFVYLSDGRSDETTVTFARLDCRARAIAARLQEMGLAGKRVLLAYPPGLDFITGFFGCLYAGCVAVPTYPPHRHRMLDRFHAIAADAGASLALSTASAVARFLAMFGRENGRPSQVPWLATDGIPDTLAEQWIPPTVCPDAMAMLQYTSGSTNDPKGVMLSHSNLIQNVRDIHHAFGMRAEEAGVFWLPTYHDMGLVGGVLEPVLAGLPSVLMPPATFLQQPIAWLTAISKYRATISGGPNFAYDLCVRKVTDEQRATLDLSSWTLAFVGAEPVLPATLDRFAEAFAPCGFKREAFYPCYGLAEATLLVSGPKRGNGATVRSFNDAALTQNRVEPVPDDASQARRMVPCGPPVGGLRVVIVDPHNDVQAAPDRVGEIWVAGPSVGQGYWHKPDQTRQSFNAHLSDTGQGPFLRTGDLGFMSEGQLYLTGRRDDLLIVRGLNHYPQDLEATARMSHPSLEAGHGAAFAWEDHGNPRLALVLEVALNGQTDFGPVIHAVRCAVTEEHGLALDVIALLRSGTIPKTSSGKVQRRACREAFLAGKLHVLAEHRGLAVEDVAAGQAAIPQPAPHDPLPSAIAIVCRHARQLGGTVVSDLSPQTPLIALGLDSLQGLELVAMLEKTYGGHLPNATINQAMTVGELAQAVQQYLINCPQPPLAAGRIPPEHYDMARFPEYTELKRQELVLTSVNGVSPYFRVDQGGSPFGGMARIEGCDLVNFCAYDYIGTSGDPQVAEAAKAAIDRYGTSAGASRLVAGEKQVHRDLEHALAAFLGTAAAIVFVSGHATNVTTIGHLLGPGDLIVHDILAHNSILQGAELSGAAARAFAHNDWQSLDALLSDVRHRYRRVLIAIEGVYSMDGDWPDLPRFVELKKKHKTLLLIDEAHSLGTMGLTGRGLGEHYGVDRADVDLWMGTLSKSLASCGGYIAGSAELVEYLKYTAPGFVYSVGLSPSNTAAALAALTVLRSQPQRVTRLQQLAALFLRLAKERGLNTGSAAGTPIVPVIIGNSAKCLRLSRALFDLGINAQPILYPAVPEHAARLRFFITTNHSEAQVHAAVDAVAEELAKL